MKMPLIALLCSLILLGLGRNVLGCPCTSDCKEPLDNKCPEGQEPICDSTKKSGGCTCTCIESEKVILETYEILKPAEKEESENSVDSKDSSYSLTVEINPAAAGVLADTGYDLALFKGYKEGGEENFDTAWHILKNNALVASNIDIMWNSFVRAGFVTQVKENNVILHQDSRLSNKFEGGQRVTFTNEGWTGPTDSTTASPPYFEVEYKPANYPMHLTLLAPVPNSDGKVEWSPFFYDKFAMDQDAISSGYPTSSLYVKLTRDIEEATYTGTAYKTGKRLDFGDSPDISICISTTEPTNEELQITLGGCAQVEHSGVEIA